MRKVVGIVMILLMLVSVTVALAGNAKPDKTDDGLKIFEKELSAVAGDEYVPDEIIVKFKPGFGKKKIDEINLGHGTSIKRAGSHFMRLNVPKGKTVDEMVGAYSRNPNVEYAEPNYIAHASMVPNDPGYPLQWHLDNAEYGGINMEDAWDISTGSGVIVAIIDTGIAYEDYQEFVDNPGRGRDYWITYAQAPDLAGTDFVSGHDFVNDDTHPNDDEGHGTHVTGTIAQTTNNGIGTAGVAFDCSIMPVKVLDSSGSGQYDWIADGIYYAANHDAQVISMSLGGTATSTTLEAALAYAYDKGITIVCSAGNDGPDGDPGYPAAYDAYCIAVGATRYDEEVSDYSTIGDYVDIAAPGGDMTVDQNGDGYYDGVFQQTHDGSDYTTFGYYFYQGTSMAAPHVSGVAALLISEGVATTPDEVREALQSTAEDKGPAGCDSGYGWGIVDAYAALSYSAAPNVPPVADAGGSYFETEDIAITFNGAGSYDSDGDSLTYAWNFGDGSAGTGVNPNHAYTAGGTYTVILVVNDGKVDSEPNTTTADITEVNDLPVAAAGSDQTALVNESVTFNGSGSYDIDSNITTYEWEFGDGTTGTGMTMIHAYGSAGMYTANLTVTDDGGLNDTDTVMVTVTEEPAYSTIHVASIDMSLKTAGPNRNAIALVKIVDGDGVPVEGATVSGDWSGVTDDSDSALTGASGEVSLKSDKVKNALSGTNFTFTVYNVSLTGWTYDPAANAETSGSITVP